jgi:hypothetical protein
MLTDEMRADGWIEHDGGECPAPLGSKMSVLYENGMILRDDEPDDRAEDWEWDGSSCFGRIIAYKPEPSHDPR